MTKVFNKSEALREEQQFKIKFMEFVLPLKFVSQFYFLRGGLEST